MPENGEENRDSEDAAASPKQANNETDSNSNSAGKHSVTLSQRRAAPAYRRSAPRSRRAGAGLRRCKVKAPLVAIRPPAPNNDGNTHGNRGDSHPADNGYRRRIRGGRGKELARQGCGEGRRYGEAGKLRRRRYEQIHNATLT